MSIISLMIWSPGYNRSRPPPKPAIILTAAGAMRMVRAGQLTSVIEDPMTDTRLEATIDSAWNARDTLSPQTQGEVREAVEAALDGLDSGQLRVAEKRGEDWHVNQWLKKAVLLSFRLSDMAPIAGGPDDPARGPAKVVAGHRFEYAQHPLLHRVGDIGIAVHRFTLVQRGGDHARMLA